MDRPPQGGRLPATPPHDDAVSCAGLRLSKSFAPGPPLAPSPFPVRKRVQKYGFFRCPQHFFQTFFQETCIALGYSEIKMRFFPGRPRKGGLFRGGKAVPDRLRGPKRRVQGTTWRTNNARTAGAEKTHSGTHLINIRAYITQKKHTSVKQKTNLQPSFPTHNSSLAYPYEIKKFVLPTANPYGISRKQQNGIP